MTESKIKKTIDAEKHQITTDNTRWLSPPD